MAWHLAIDIGASSGRHILGRMEDGRMQTEEVYRFPNGAVRQDGHLVWDLEALERHVLAGLQAAFRRAPDLQTVSIDTWGVDYVLLQGDTVLSPCYAYRDSRTEAAVQAVHSRIPFEELYRHTGCQFQSFNTIYQLQTDLENGRLAQATDLLMMPEYLLWRLTGRKVREYTNATTTGLVNAAAREYDREILDTLGLPAQLFPALTAPGTVLGPLLPDIAQKVGGNCTAVLCATHDTASAVEGIPMQKGEHAAWLSSGTWSLLGVNLPAPVTDAASLQANFTNEGGPGYIRYLKNIMGMWLLNELKRELAPEADWDSIVQAAEQSTYDALVDASSPAFLAPASMRAAFDAALPVPPQTPGDYFRCACRSLADCYRVTLEELTAAAGWRPARLYIVGGGAKNRFLNACTAELTGMEIAALPIEATALGNLKLQMEAVK